MRASEIVAAMEDELRAKDAVIAGLKAQLAARPIPKVRDEDSPDWDENAADPDEWAKELSPGSAAVLALLVAAKGRVLTKAYLEENSRPDHARERDLNIIAVHINAIRAALGKDAVKTVWGVGWKAGPRFLAKKAEA